MENILFDQDKLNVVINSYLKYMNISSFDFDNAVCSVIKSDSKITFNYILYGSIIYNLYISFYSDKVNIYFFTYNSYTNISDNEYGMRYTFSKDNDKLNVFKEYFKFNNNGELFNSFSNIDSISISNNWSGIMGLIDSDNDVIENHNNKVKRKVNL